MHTMWKKTFHYESSFEERKLKKYHEDIHNLMNNAKFIIDNEDVPKTANSRIYTEKIF